MTRVAILGSGNIGTDLLVKVLRSQNLSCVLFSGRNYGSEGMRKANELGVPVSDLGISAVIERLQSIDIIFDATSASAHIEHWAALKDYGKLIVDLTPSRIGNLCVPVVNGEQFQMVGGGNVSMVTCGGQASLPIASAIAAVQHRIDYIEVASNIASRSAGPATRRNIDEYIETTEDALIEFCGASRAKAVLILNPALPPIDMQTTIYVKTKDPDMDAINRSVESQVKRVREYVPGYQLIVPPTLVDDTLVMSVKVIGNGDYLPRYAGNLDIINCAAIDIAEKFKLQQELGSL